MNPALLLLLLAGCPSKDDSDSVDTTPAPACDAVTFASEGVDWSLPSFEGENWRDGVPFSEASGISYRDCAAGEGLALQYFFDDFTADGVPDLVVTYDGCDPAGLGKSHWDVYGGTGTGFLSTAIAWTLPTFEGTGWGGDAPLAATGGETFRSCGGSDQSLFHYQLMDMNADAVPDLVVTLDQCEGTAIGTSVWEVFPGGSGGFATEPTAWNLPTLNGDSWTGVAVPFYATDGGTWRDCNGDHYADVYHNTIDLTGDGWPDLVITYDTCANPDLSFDYWWVYPGGEEGFASESQNFSLPERVGEDWYEDGRYTSVDGEALRTCDGLTGLSLRYTTRDMDGDGKVDLAVINDECDTSGLGDGHWDVYPGDGSGFAATPVAWTLPPTEGENWNRGVPFADLADRDERDCGTLTDVVMRYQMVDITGDGVPDMVVTIDPCVDADLGGHYWWVYPGDPAGFATTPLEWTLPYPDGISWSKDVPYPEMNESSYRDCGTIDEADYNFSTFVLDGDANPDLVVTYDACAGDDIGTSRWHVYPGACE